MNLFTTTFHEPVHIQVSWICSHPSFMNLFTTKFHKPVHIQVSLTCSHPSFMNLFTTKFHEPVHIQVSWTCSHPSFMNLFTSKFHEPVHNSPTHWSLPSTRWSNSTSPTSCIFKIRFNIILPLHTLTQWSNMRYENAYDDCFLVLAHLQAAG